MKRESQKEINNLIGGYDFKCALCGADTFVDNELFCPRCAKEIFPNDGKTCLTCGTALYGIEDYCSKCGKAKRSFDKAVSVFRYEGEIKRLFYKFKFFGYFDLCRRLAPLLKKCYQANFSQPFDYVTYVPSEIESQRERGYNQSYLLCKGLCDIINFSAVSLLVKVKAIKPQEGLSFLQRVENVKGAYVVAEEFADKLKGKSVLIIDDVLTTGATADECALRLKKKGAVKVCVLTVASRAETILSE